MCTETIACVDTPQAKSETRGRKPILEYRNLESVSFDYEGKTYTIHRDLNKNVNMNGKWEDRAFCRLYGLWRQRLVGQNTNAPRKYEKRPKKWCKLCQAYVRSENLHESTVKHKMIVNSLKQTLLEAKDYLNCYRDVK